MAYHDETLSRIYDRTRGYRHLCGQKVYRTNYAHPGCRGAWEVDHGRPRGKGGGDHGNNLRPACIPCNREKGAMTSRTVRRWNGQTRAPLSRSQYREARQTNTLRRAAAGSLAGLRFGPAGAVLGGLAGLPLGFVDFDFFFLLMPSSSIYQSIFSASLRGARSAVGEGP